MLEETVSQLPKTEEGVKNAFEACSSRQKYIQVQKADFKLYLEKAKSDLKNIENDYKAEAWDWVVVKVETQAGKKNIINNVNTQRTFYNYNFILFTRK